MDRREIGRHIGKAGMVLSRAQFDALREQGWTCRPATLNQAWPAHKPANPMVRVVQLSAAERMPFVFVPPSDRQGG